MATGWGDRMLYPAVTVSQTHKVTDSQCSASKLSVWHGERVGMAHHLIEHLEVLSNCIQILRLALEQLSWLIFVLDPMLCRLR